MSTTPQPLPAQPADNPAIVSSTPAPGTPVAPPAAPAAPEPVAPPVVDDAVARYAHLYAEPPASEPTMADLQRTIQDLQQSLASVQSSAPAPAVDPAVADRTFVDFVREGKFKEAQEFLISQARAAIMADAQKFVSSEIQERTYVQTELNTFNEQLRRENPELAPLEDLVASRAQAELLDLQRNGVIKTPQEFVTNYKKVVAKHTDAARKLIQQYRGAGKTEALTTNPAVVTSSAAPTGVRNVLPTDAVPQPKATIDVIRDRQSRLAAMQGVG